MRDPIDDDYEDNHKMPQNNDYIEIAINPPIHLQALQEDSLDRYLEMKQRFTNIYHQITGCDDKLAFMEMSIGGLYHLHMVVRIRDPHSVLNSLINLKYMQVKAHYELKQRVMVYRIKNEEHLISRIEYISKDYNEKTNVNLIGRDTNKFGHLYEVFQNSKSNNESASTASAETGQRVLNKSKDLCVERSRDTKFYFWINL